MTGKKTETPKQKPKGAAKKNGRPPALTLDMQIESVEGKADSRLPVRKLLTNLGALMCTIKEAASVLGVTEKTLHEFFKRNPEARELFNAGQDKGKVSLRRKMFDLAEKNATMAIFLAMNLLGMKDRREFAGPGPGGSFPTRLEELTDEQLMLMAARLRAMKQKQIKG